MLHTARNILIFAGSLLGLLRLTDLLYPASATTVAAAKLEQVTTSAEPYDVIFLGNSHVYRHVVPAQFDAAMARHGHRLRSYNLAAPGMTYPEMDYVIRQVLSRDPKLRLVIIDTSLEWEDHEENLASERSVAWHDAQGTLLASTVALHRDEPLVRRNFRVNRHLSVFFSRETHHGYAVRWLASVGRGAQAPYDLAGHEQGFLALDEDPDPTLDLRRGQFVRERAQYREAMDRLRRRGRVFVPCADVEKDQVQRLVRRLHRRGVQVVFYFSPLIDAQVPDWREAAPEVPYFVFNDPDRFPRLYAVGQRFDANHMNSRGAAEFTGVLADSVATVLALR